VLNVYQKLGIFMQIDSLNVHWDFLLFNTYFLVLVLAHGTWMLVLVLILNFSVLVLNKELCHAILMLIVDVFTPGMFSRWYRLNR